MIVEKDGIFQRLIEDEIYHIIPSIVVTGRGFPDLATREFVHRLVFLLHLPVVILCDNDPFGVAITLNYKCGSARMPTDSPFFPIDAKWIGLRPSDSMELDFPAHTKEPLTARDRAKLTKLIASPYIQVNPAYLQELLQMQELDYKVELEAFHAFGFDAITTYLVYKLSQADFI